MFGQPVDVAKLGADIVAIAVKKNQTADVSVYRRYFPAVQTQALRIDRIDIIVFQVDNVGGVNLRLQRLEHELGTGCAAHSQYQKENIAERARNAIRTGPAEIHSVNNKGTGTLNFDVNPALVETLRN
jgi:hypothetical protein